MVKKIILVNWIIHEIIIIKENLFNWTQQGLVLIWITLKELSDMNGGI